MKEKKTLEELYKREWIVLIKNKKGDYMCKRLAQ